MSDRERREHFRIEDNVYFNYKVIQEEELYADQEVRRELLGDNGFRYMETKHYFQSIDMELAQLNKKVAKDDPILSQFLNLLNAKIDYLSRQILLSTNAHHQKVNLSLGGMTFQAFDKIKEDSLLKIVIYTKPNMIPIIVSAEVVYCQFEQESYYRTAVEFTNLTQEQETILSQHLVQAQAKAA